MDKCKNIFITFVLEEENMLFFFSHDISKSVVKAASNILDTTCVEIGSCGHKICKIRFFISYNSRFAVSPMRSHIKPVLIAHSRSSNVNKL